jgi:hypothetical protein
MSISKYINQYFYGYYKSLKKIKVFGYMNMYSICTIRILDKFQNSFELHKENKTLIMIQYNILHA